jgi:hypothetical protein
LNNSLSSILFLLGIIILGIFSANVNRSLAQSANPIETDSLTITINSIEPITNDLSPSQISEILETDYLVTRSILNEENVGYNLEIPEGVFRWLYSESMHNVTIFDSLNQHFAPIIENNTISNPSFEIDLAPNSADFVTFV